MASDTPDGGVWEVLTKTARYLLDLERGTVVRLPVRTESGDLAPGVVPFQLDERMIPLIGVSWLEVGEPMMLKILTPSSSAPSTRITNRVMAMRKVAEGMDAPDGLGPSSTGLWVVHTNTSLHWWDLDAGTYERDPGPTAVAFPEDRVAMRIYEVAIWPAVGGVFYVLCENPDDPDLLSWRISATILGMERRTAKPGAGR